MKILFATGIYPPEIGGAASAVHDAALALVRIGHEVTVVTYGAQETTSENDSGIRVVRVSRRGSVLERYVRFAAQVRQASSEATCVCVTDISSAGIPVRLALLGKTVPVLYRLGGERAWENAIQHKKIFVPLRRYWRERLGGFSQWCTEQQYKIILGPVRQIMVVSSLLRDCLVQIEPRWDKKIRVVPTRIRRVQGEKRQDAHTPRRFIFVGRFTVVKNLAFFVRALRRLASESPSFECLFVGDGEEYALRASELKSLSQVQMLGLKSREETHALLRTADVLVLPSITDVYPQVVIEALSMGVPVLMTSEHGLEPGFGGIQEVDPENEEAWVKAMATLLSKETYETLRRAIFIPNPVGETWAEVIIATLES
ncbi:glycosyltransferase family 4 protein [Patescibacteria group bacterium]|nr:glycosyltransferase family 4 protein [Patescibacteria group bacterium]